MRPPTIIAALAIILASTAPSPAQPNVQGAVELSNGTRVPQNPSLPKLNLTNMQREQIRKIPAEGRTARQGLRPCSRREDSKGN
jgi:Spy/CpxP family protein refolding chaperone